MKKLFKLAIPFTAAFLVMLFAKLNYAPDFSWIIIFFPIFVYVVFLLIPFILLAIVVNKQEKQKNYGAIR